MQRRITAQARERLELRFRGEEQVQRLHVAVQRRPMQRRHAVSLRGVHIGSLRDQGLKHGRVAAHRGVGDRRLRLGAGDRAQGRNHDYNADCFSQCHRASVTGFT